MRKWVKIFLAIMLSIFALFVSAIYIVGLVIDVEFWRLAVRSFAYDFSSYINIFGQICLSCFYIYIGTIGIEKLFNTYKEIWNS